MGEYARLNSMLQDLEASYDKLSKKKDKSDEELEILYDLSISIGEVKGALLENASIDGLEDPYEAFDM